MHTSTVVLESQPDWVTAVAIGQRHASTLAGRAHALMRAEKVAGNREIPFHTGEYTGTMCGRVRFGERHGAALCQLSGDLASLHLHWVLTHTDRLTRLDLAVTVRTQRYEADIAEQMFADALTYHQVHARSAVPTLIVNGGGGSTCYIGKRTSDRYFRAYDKDAECRASNDPDALDRYRNAWRFELELHDDAATLVAHALPQHPHRATWISAYIAGYQLDHGQTPIYDPTAPPVHVGGFRRRSDRESRLNWLSTSVAPTVRWLIESTPKGELMKRLGLGDDVEGTA